MSRNQSMIDEALEHAKQRLGAAGSRDSEKTASSTPDFVKEATEVANALEFVARSTVDDGTPQAPHNQSILDDFFKGAAGKKGPAAGSTDAGGTQQQPPVAGKTKMPIGNTGATNPENSESPEGVMGRDKFKQEPPAVKKPPLDGGGKQAGLSMFDILMSQQTEKEAAGGGPKEFSSTDAAPGIPSKNENSNRDALLGSNEAPVSATKREAKKPTRARLAEVFAHTHDTVGDATAKAVWPNAAQKGDMKIAGAKEGSLYEFSELFDLASKGELGKEAQVWAAQVESM